VAQTFFNPADVSLDFLHTYMRSDHTPVDAAFGQQVRQAAPEIGGYRVEAGVLRTWRPLPPAVARRLKLRMLR
jgi:hypothetical protein